MLLYLWKSHRTKTTKLSIIQPSVAEMCISLLLVYDISYWIILLDHDTKIFYKKSMNSNVQTARGCSYIMKLSVCSYNSIASGSWAIFVCYECECWKDFHLSGGLWTMVWLISSISQNISFLNIHTLINKTNSTQCINSYKTAVHVHSKLVFLCLIFSFFYFSIIALYF